MNFHEVLQCAKFVAATAAFSMVLSGCGGDKKPSSPERGDDDDPTLEDESSSSKGDAKPGSSSSKGDSKNSSDSKSSSSGKNDSDNDSKSSSSVKGESGENEKSSSSVEVEVPSGTRVATLADLPKNLSLGDEFGTEVFLATGSKNGLFSLWGADSAWIVFDSKFENGVLSFKSDAGFSGLSNTSQFKPMQDLLEKGATISFIVDPKDSVMFSTDGKNFKKAEPAMVSISNSKMSNAENLKGTRLTCKNGDLSEEYSFYNGRYFLEVKDGDKDVSWSAGYYDIHRSNLLMIPKFFMVQDTSKGRVSALSTYFVNPSSMEFTFYGNLKKPCEKAELNYEEVAAKDMVGSWIAEDGSVEWSLDLKSSGEFKVLARESGDTKQSKAGIWDVYGDMMFWQAKGCLNPSSCTQFVKGVVEGMDPKAGFRYNHDDSDSPKMPKIWTLPQYE